MQDQYSAMMDSQQRSDHHNSLHINLQSNASNSPSFTFNPNFCVDMKFGSTYGTDMYQPMPVAPLSQFYTSMRACMQSPNPMNSTCGISTTSCTTPTAASPQDASATAVITSEINVMTLIPNVSSPGSSSTSLSTSFDRQRVDCCGHVLSNLSLGENITTEPIDKSILKSGIGENSCIPKKRSSNEKRDDNYWERRQKNNESATRSREARRMKEEHLARRLVFLENENQQLRAEVRIYQCVVDNLQRQLLHT